MKKITCLLVGVFIMNIFSFAQYDPKARTILDEMSKKYSQMSGFKAKFSYTLNNKEASINESSEGEIIVKGAKFNLKMSGQEIINNGTTVWTYLKETNEVNVTDYTPDEDDITPTKVYTIYKKGYKYLYIEEKTEAGKVYDVIDLIPEDKSKQVFKIRLEINKKDKSVKSWKIFEKNGNIFNYNVKLFTPDLKLEDSFFVFDKAKYSGVQVNDLR